jgi:hypothetical protein
LSDVAEQINANDFNYQLIPAHDWNNALFDQQLGLQVEHEFTVSDLSEPIRRHFQQFEQQVHQVVHQYESGHVSHEDGVRQIKTACQNISVSAFGDPSLTDSERIATAESFALAAELGEPLTQYLDAYATAHGLPPGARFLRRWLLTMARIQIGIAVTATLVALPAAGAAAAKAAVLGMALSKVKIGGVKGIGAITKTALFKGKIGGMSLKAPILTGMGAGLKHAAKSWDKPWQGASEFTFGIKIKL